MNPSKWSHAIIKFLCKGNAFWTRFSVRSGSLGTRRVAPARAVLEVFPQNFESGKTACLLSSSGRSLEKSLSGRLSGVTLQYLRRELPPSRRLCCGGDVSLRFSASPTISPPPPHPLCAAAGPRGASGPGVVPLPRARALQTCLPSSLHSSMGNRRCRRSRVGAGGGSRRGSRAAEAGSLPSPAGARACSPFPARGARPPLAFSLRVGPLGGLRPRSGGAEAPGRASLGCGLVTTCLRPLALEPAWCDRPRPPGHRGRGPGSGARLHPRGV